MIATAHLFHRLSDHLIQLLHSLTSDEWSAPTLAKQWTVKDVAAHLLDGNIRTLSMQRDRYFGTQPTRDISTYQGLVQWLNTLNHEWVTAARRISPDVLIMLLEITAPLVSDYYASLPPEAPAMFPVAWAGEQASPNWMHVAREYTEHWHHQQQIRHAVGQTAPLMIRELFFPVIATFMRALPHAYRHTNAQTGTIIRITVSSDSGGTWLLERTEEAWGLHAPFDFEPIEHTTQPTQFYTDAPKASITLPPDTAWMLFTKGISAHKARSNAAITGDERLAEPLFTMVTVMA
jgi:uncharacterized protein (TIGR03083 family)